MIVQQIFTGFYNRNFDFKAFALHMCILYNVWSARALVDNEKKKNLKLKTEPIVRLILRIVMAHRHSVPYQLVVHSKNPELRT